MVDAPKNFDRFKPTMPRIPGVADRQTEQENPSGSSRWKSTARVAAPLAAALTLGSVTAWWTLRMPRRVATAPATTAQTSQALPANPAPTTALVLPDGSVEVATLQELAKPWSSKKFLFRKPFGNESVPAIVVRLPGAASRSASYWAFSLRAPFGHCELEYVTDVGKLSSQYGYHARYAMVADPCSGTLYDPLRLGTLPGGAWARGEVVRGSGVRPPFAIEVSIQGSHLVAARTE